MMLMAPGFLFAALGVAATVIALHFIVTRRPRAGVLPTARFVPDLPATAPARATQPSDLLLMLLRVLIVLGAGTALAGPVLKPSRLANARVILVDVSRAVRGTADLRDRALGVYRDGDAVILFDSSARQVGGSVRDSLSALTPSARKGNLSGALIAAMRAGSGLRERADSLQLIVVSPLATEEMDAATDSIRMLWPGNARLVRLVAPPDTALPSSVPFALRAVASDPLHVTISLARRMNTAGALIVRGAPSAADADAASREGRALIEWPATGRPRGALSRAKRDTIGGVVADTAIVIAGFEREWKFAGDSLRGAQVVARWIDGEPAVVEWPAGGGCIRSVAVPVIVAGDLVIRDDFVRFVAAISGECAGRATDPMTPAAIASLAGKGGMVSREAFRPDDDVRSTLAPWLFAFAIAAALAELFVRRRSQAVRGAVSPSPAASGSTS